MCEVAVPADAYSPGTYLLVMLTPTWGVSDPRLRAGVGQVAGSGLNERGEADDARDEHIQRDVRG